MPPVAAWLTAPGERTVTLPLVVFSAALSAMSATAPVVADLIKILPTVPLVTILPFTLIAPLRVVIITEPSIPAPWIPATAISSASVSSTNMPPLVLIPPLSDATVVLILSKLVPTPVAPRRMAAAAAANRFDASPVRLSTIDPALLITDTEAPSAASVLSKILPTAV